MVPVLIDSCNREPMPTWGKLVVVGLVVFIVVATIVEDRFF